MFSITPYIDFDMPDSTDSILTESGQPCRLPIIGLVGGIGSGKSTVANILASLGCLVVNSDDLAKLAMNDPDVQQQLREWWGEQVFTEDGSVNRSAIAHIVFSDKSERAQLEGLIHPWVEQRRRELFSSPPAGTLALVIDAPLLLEAGLVDECDAILFVDSSKASRLERVQVNRGWDAAELARREEAQFSLDFKRQHADDTVSNDGCYETLHEQVEAAFSRILQRNDSDAAVGDVS